ncbi:ISPsy2, transposase [Pseudomonas syringae pv. actinidiae ICMP 19071]|nr:ISPsy2, transposase [Pseudomonas syringae pv. actinidiae ICMP 19071]
MMKKMTFADAEYAGKRKQKREEHAGRKVIWQIAARRSFRVIKRQFGYEKVRFRGLAKNTAQMVTLFALSNLWMARRHLLASAGEVRV